MVQSSSGTAAPQKKGKWVETLPEQRDPIHSCRVYPSDNVWGIPTLKPVPLALVPDFLIPFRTRLRDGRSPEGYAVHFYIDDYRFNSAWGKPYAVMNGLKDNFKAVLTPDYSLYIDMPPVLKTFNVYRNRWCGAFWTEHTDLVVIPSLSWDTPDTFEYSFLGVPQNSVVAVKGVANSGNPSNPVHYNLYKQGYTEMVSRLHPSLIIIYGQIPSELSTLAPIRCYPTRWQEIREQRKALKDGIGRKQ